MEDTYVSDVGDGLCMAIHTIFGKTIQIDCGSQQGSKVAFNGLERILNGFYSPDVFILSHFHIDHYNGLLYASLNRHRHPPHIWIKEVYYARIPEFREKEKFICCLYAMNVRVFGSETGIMEYDFLKAISKISYISFRYRSLSKGDEINVNGSTFEVLWPPRVIDDNKTLSVVERALKDFEKAMEEDRETRRLYDRVREEGIFRTYFEEEGIFRIHYGEEEEKSEFREDANRYINAEYKRKELPEVVKEANKSLRQAANHLSLALFEDNRLLFLGDTENFEIKQIAEDLKSKGRKNFYVFITPHHGTHWHRSLTEIRSVYSITSNSSRSSSKMVPHFKETSKRSFATCVNGDVVVPVYPTSGFWRMSPRRFYEEI